MAITGETFLTSYGGVTVHVERDDWGPGKRNIHLGLQSNGYTPRDWGYNGSTMTVEEARMVGQALIDAANAMAAADAADTEAGQMRPVMRIYI